MKTGISIFGAALTAFVATASQAAKPKEWAEYGVEAKIPFANNGGIRNFEANGDRGIWIEDRQRRWYYARIIGPCHNLSHANGLAFDTRGAASLDKFGGVIAGREYCQFDSLVTAEKPLPRKERIQIRKEVRAEAKKAVAPDD
ncbi:DUF6491 family protein [uncultured Sphingorhabdus sp.]|uniref:DUF6491 family protein n=1 Tax=uncultured Sphingorhabdus sp. TaxID=1686106 RepID=UPI00261B92BB|nr:DUF6491 family protein [uncultured Sphingorhabdus sp.]HMS21173.1 DUF6491 family protein [Sphingorhabdus sp.]